MKKILSILIVMTLIFNMCPAIKSYAFENEVLDIPEQAVQYNGHTYAVFYVDRGTWDEAQAKCESIGGYLAVIDSEEENEFLYSLMHENGYQNAYFGLTDKDEEGIWKTVKGKDIQYENWAAGEPNNQAGNAEAENYAMFYYRTGGSQWNDGDGILVDCAYFCEWDASEDAGNTGADSDITQQEQSYTSEHLDFVNSSMYEERMKNKWANVISTGLDTSTGKAGETMYNIIDAPCDIVTFQLSDLFDNPYDVIIADIILKQAELQQNEFVMEFNNSFNKNFQYLKEICSYYDGSYVNDLSQYKTSLEKLIEMPQSVKESEPKFYDICTQLFNDLYEKGQLNDFLVKYGKANDLIEGLEKYGNVIEWVADCLKYNSLVEAYINTSDEFKSTLLLAEYYMAINASGDEFVSRVDYGILYGEAYDKFLNFMTNEKIADELYDAYYNERLFEEYFKNGMGRISDVFGSAIQKNVISYLSQGLGLTEATAGEIFAAVWATKVGWGISEAITGNEDNIECRELARACYYLEDAMAWIVEDSASNLKEKQTYEAARQFDASYSILQDLECYALSNYITYLNAQQQSFWQSMLHGFDMHFNDTEIALANAYKLRWQQVDCHSNSERSANSNISIAKICCPVDVYVYDKDVQLVFCIEDNKVRSESSYVSGSVVNEMKILAIADIENYTIEIKATDNGTMDYLVDTYDAVSGDLLASSVFTDVSIEKGKTYTGVTDEVIQLYDEEKEIGQTNGITDGEVKIVVNSVDIVQSSIEMQIGDTANLVTNILPEDAYCPVVSWSSSHENIVSVNEYGQIMANGVGSAVIQCITVDGSQCADTIEINVVDIPANNEDVSGDNEQKDDDNITPPGETTTEGKNGTTPEDTTNAGYANGSEKQTPSTDTPVTDGSVTNTPFTDNPATNNSVTNTPVNDNPTNNNPINTPVTNTPVMDGIKQVIPLAVNTVLTDPAKQCTVVVTSSDATNPTVAYKQVADKQAKNVTVPDTVSIDGVTYTVTSIADNAFAKNKNITKITIGKNVTSIGRNAFKDCTKLKIVNIKSNKLNKIGANAFSGAKKLAKITIKSKQLTKTSIGKNVFKGTKNKLVIKVPKTMFRKYKTYFKNKGNKTIQVKK